MVQVGARHASKNSQAPAASYLAYTSKRETVRRTVALVGLRRRPIELMLRKERTKDVVLSCYTTSVDIWSTGCIMAELLVGTIHGTVTHTHTHTCLVTSHKEGRNSIVCHRHQACSWRCYAWPQQVAGLFTLCMCVYTGHFVCVSVCVCVCVCVCVRMCACHRPAPPCFQVTTRYSRSTQSALCWAHRPTRPGLGLSSCHSRSKTTM